MPDDDVIFSPQAVEWNKISNFYYFIINVLYSVLYILTVKLNTRSLV